MNLESRLISLVSKLAPWLATFPTAWAIGVAVNVHLGWPLLVAIITGVSVETLGVASAATALDLYSYQRGKRKSDPDSPVLLGVALVALYFVAVIALTVVLDGNPFLAVFPLLSLAAVGNLALRADQSARLAQIEIERTQKRTERAQALNVTATFAEFQRSTSLAANPALSWASRSEPANADPLPPVLEACPKCGRSDFTGRFQRSGHIGKCKGASL